MEVEPAAETITGRCVKCRENRVIVNPEIRLNKKSRLYAQGECPVFGKKMCTIVSARSRNPQKSKSKEEEEENVIGV